MLSRIVSPKNKQELIRSLQSANIRNVQVFEGDQLSDIPTPENMKRQKATVIVLKP